MVSNSSGDILVRMGNVDRPPHTRRIVWHTLTLPYHINQKHSEQNQFSWNGLLFAEPGDLVLVDAPLSGAYLNYLQQLYLSHSTNTIAPAAEISALTGTHSEFDLFAKDDRIQKILADHSLSSVLQTNLFSKATARKMIKRARVRTTFGLVSSSPALLKVAVLFLLLSGRSAQVKKTISHGGYDTRIWQPHEWREVMRSTTVCAPDEILPADNTYVVDEWHPCCLFAPSVGGYVSEAGVEVRSLHNQLLAKNRRTYIGCQSADALPIELRQQVLEDAQRIMESYAAIGYRGDLSIDAIYPRGGPLHFTEVDTRKGMSSYAQKLFKKLGHSGLVYQSRFIRKQEWLGLSVEEFMKHMNNFLFSSTNERGFVPFNLRLQSTGGCSLFAMGESQLEIDQNFAILDEYFT